MTFIGFAFPSFAEVPTLASTIPSLLFSLVVVIAIVVALATILKKTSLVANKSNGMKVVSMLPLSTKERLIVVEVEGEQLLLGVTNNQINLLKKLDSPIAEKAGFAEQGFKNLLQQTIKKNANHD
ncbi:flagellar biosynthetic protein FliO [Catenovulum sp. SM1970]|nr:flagellar biosynthetic protein FliO [Marinifaba aquimaris]NTS76386.1 flagellar biosynthetic protein FliO [Marinifaba aquimaris]